jgi:hypothetical protein
MQIIYSIPCFIRFFRNLNVLIKISRTLNMKLHNNLFSGTRVILCMQRGRDLGDGAILVCAAQGWKALKNGNHYPNMKAFCKLGVIFHRIFSLHMSFCLHVLGNLAPVLDPNPLLSVFFNFLPSFALRIYNSILSSATCTHPLYLHDLSIS